MRKNYDFGYSAFAVSGTNTNIIQKISEELKRENFEIIGLTLFSDTPLGKEDLKINEVGIPLMPMQMGNTTKYALSLENISLKNLVINKSCNIEIYYYLL